ncbi:MAG: M48 family metalloprotease [Candidatus Nanohaloarchaea archaeon]
MAAWFNQILMRESLFEEGNEVLRDYVFLHEKGHTRESTIVRVSYLPFGVLLQPSFLVLELALIAIAALSATTGLLSGPGKLEVVRTGAIVSATVIPVAVVYSWAIELKAEIFAIERMEIEDYRKAVEQLDRSSKRNILQEVSYRLNHPPKWLAPSLADRRI